MQPSDYGSSMGGYKPIEAIPLALNLSKGGLDYSRTADKLDEGMTPYALDVRFDLGGVSADFDVSNFGSASASAADKTVMKLAPLELAAGTKFMMRLRPTKWDRWDGANWLELPGTLTGTSVDRVYTANYGDYFIAANGVDKLKMWPGVDVTAVADLSADSPIATYITKVGNRILAARIERGGVTYPYDLQWSEDGNPLGWTSATNGAGGNTLGPEGTNRATNLITGLSTLEGAGVIYRQRTIVMALQTGIGASPFRFVTVDFGHGTYSPYSIGNGGEKTGDYFLGDDYMVYFFDGRGLPVPIGDPILNVLRSAIYDPRYVQGRVDARGQEYWLAYPTDSTLLLKKAYVFSIREWVKNNRLVWRHRALGAGYTAMDFGAVPTTVDPFIDSMTAFVDTDATRVNDYGVTAGDERLLFGDGSGQAYYQDLAKPLTSGVWTSQVVGDDQTRVSVDRVRIKAKAGIASVVEVSISSDGSNFSYPKNYMVAPTGDKTLTIGDYFGVDATNFQFQLRIISGDVIVSQIAYTLNNHGKAA